MQRLKTQRPFYVALVHYPVLNRRGDTIASAITNLDLHDLARLVRTYALPACYIISPLKDQQALAAKLLEHWRTGVGRELHPHRAEALDRVRIAEDIETAAGQVFAETGQKPQLWATSANRYQNFLPLRKARHLVNQGTNPVVLLFGTGWGFSASVVERVDAVLEPIEGLNGYNHLSVRCAAAIIIDRLMGDRPEYFEIPS